MTFFFLSFFLSVHFSLLICSAICVKSKFGVYLKDSKFRSKIILEHEMHFPVEMLIVFAEWLAKSHNVPDV